MSTTFMLEELKKISDLNRRKAEADRLFGCFYDRIPSGAYNPGIWNYDHSDSEVLSWLKFGEDFFSDIKLLCGNEFTPKIQQLYSSFLKNSEYTKKLLSLDRGRRRCLETHEIFPFYIDFNEVIHNLFGKCNSEIPDALVFHPKLIGKGGFASVYEALDGGGRKYALKLFHNPDSFFADERRVQNGLLNFIAENISSQRDLWMEKPFIAVRAINSTDIFYNYFAYIMDFFEGENVTSLLDNHSRELDRTLSGRILLLYAEMLSNLHSQKKVFIDHDWSNVLISDDEIRICDVDLVTPVYRLKEIQHYLFHRCFASREHLTKKKPTFSGDLESFALMAHEIITRESFIQADKVKNYENYEKAKQNRREYPEQYRALLPRKLREIIPALITYPRDNSINANDFLSAIKSDFRL